MHTKFILLKLKNVHTFRNTNLSQSSFIVVSDAETSFCSRASFSGQSVLSSHRLNMMNDGSRFNTFMLRKRYLRRDTPAKQNVSIPYQFSFTVTYKKNRLIANNKLSVRRMRSCKGFKLRIDRTFPFITKKRNMNQYSLSSKLLLRVGYTNCNKEMECNKLQP